MKVIGFDGWTVGSHHYRRLLDAFAARNLDLTLIHLGSWGNETERPTEEVIAKLPVKDISFYRGKGFRAILELERPAAVIFLSIDAFAHRAFNRYSRKLAIPTVHLFHGLEQLMDTLPAEPNPLRRLWRMRSHVAKMARYFLPVYARSLRDTDASADEWIRFARDVTGRIRARQPTQAAKDSRADRACVYIESEVDYAVNRYGYEKDDVVVVGNPDLASFKIHASLIGSRLGSTMGNNEVVYIETALSDYGAVYTSERDFIRHIVATHLELAKRGKRLVLKTHPSTGPSKISALRSEGIQVCPNDSFLKALEACCACITEPSSASLIPAVIGLPLFQVKYGKHAKQVFGKLIDSYPRARQLSDLRDFDALLAAERASFDRIRTMNWIARNTGPLPSEDMPGRVADVVTGLIEDHGKRA